MELLGSSNVLQWLTFNVNLHIRGVIIEILKNSWLYKKNNVLFDRSYGLDELVFICKI